jgi:hypothetical protein
MAARRTTGKRLNSSARPVTTGPQSEQPAARRAYVARLAALVRSERYEPKVDRLVVAMTGSEPPPRRPLPRAALPSDPR